MKVLSRFLGLVMFAALAGTDQATGQDQTGGQVTGTTACTLSQAMPANANILNFLKRGDVQKGEYESSSDYQARIAKLFRAGSNFTIVAPAPILGEYDADREELRINSLLLLGDLENIQLESKYTPIRTYVGENAFGVQRTIQVGDTDTYRVSLAQSSIGKYALNGDTVTIKMPRQTARQSSNEISRSGSGCSTAVRKR